jgi:hypothetical protein
MSAWSSFKREILADVEHVPGWCSAVRADLMMDLVVEHGLRTCVDVGAFGGASCLPVAEALRYCGAGEVHAVDAWRRDIAVEGWNPETPDYRWWSALDFDRLHDDFEVLLHRRGLAGWCRIVRMHSIEAAARFADASIDFIHMDGSHHDEGALADARAFLPKLRDGGLLLFNDAHWTCMRRALVFLLERGRLLTPYTATSAFLLIARDVARERRAASLMLTDA